MMKTKQLLVEKSINLNTIFSKFEDKMPYNFETNIGNSDYSDQAKSGGGAGA